MLIPKFLSTEKSSSVQVTGGLLRKKNAGLSKLNFLAYLVSMKSLSVTLICKNEQHNLARLLPQLSFADEIVVVDTGSTDDTMSVAKKFTKSVFQFAWCDDFSKARNCAIKHTTCDYVMWIDADDVVPPETQQFLIKWKKDDMGWKKTQNSADFLYMKYEMDTQIPFWFWRERIIRRTQNCRFKGFIHEAIVPFGRVDYLDCKILHRPSASHEQRNLAIYRKAMEQGKRFSLRDKFYFAKTLLECGKTAEALPILRKFVSNPRAYVVDRVDGYKLLSHLAQSEGSFAQARKLLTQSLAILPPSSEVCCLLGNTYFDEQNYRHASQWYTLALSCNNQYGFVNEYYSKFLPNLQLSVCLWQLGDRQGATRCHNAAKSICPTDSTILLNDKWFSNIEKE